MLEVRRAVPEDIPALATMFARAFADDPVAHYVFPAGPGREDKLRRFFRLQLTWNYLRRGDAFTVADNRSGALWLPPGVRSLTLVEQVRQTPFFLHTPRSYLAMQRLGYFLALHHPPTPHYYLATLGTDPECRGRGLASALLASALAFCDRHRLPAYLQASSEKNVGFYERHGFAVTGETDLPGGGPRLWLMWRDPAPAGEGAG